MNKKKTWQRNKFYRKIRCQIGTQNTNKPNHVSIYINIASISNDLRTLRQEQQWQRKVEVGKPFANKNLDCHQTLKKENQHNKKTYEIKNIDTTEKLKRGKTDKQID